MEIGEILKSAKSENNYNISLLEYELILAHILNKSREWILTYPRYKLSKKQDKAFQALIKRRIKGEPLAYLLGHKEFYGLDFYVNKNVLIPRPETELMVDEIHNLISNDSQNNKNLRQPFISIIDVGTGSGCIIISLAKILKKFKNNFQFFGLDISAQAIQTAKKNARKHKVKVNFYRGNLLEPILNKKNLSLEKDKLIIAANLPYLAPGQIKNSPSIKFEPIIALDAGGGGLKYYCGLFRQIASFFPKDKKMPEMVIYCEIDPGQKTAIARLAKKFFLKFHLQIKKDLRGHSRLAVITTC